MAEKRQLVARGRGPGRPFKPGNPGGGRPKGSKSITTVVRDVFTAGNLPAQIAADLRALTKDKDPRVRLAAIREVLDRCGGLAEESINLKGSLGLYELQQSIAARKTIQWMRANHPDELDDLLDFVGVTR